MVKARVINDTTTIDVHGENQQTTVGVTSRSELSRVNINSTADHNSLINRNLPNQHSISSITGLEEALLNANDKNFVYEQEIPSVEWVIDHNLNKCPNVVTVDSAGSVKAPDEIVYNSDSRVTVTFLSAFAGKAFLN
jgi:hypothetical protein